MLIETPNFVLMSIVWHAAMCQSHPFATNTLFVIYVTVQNGDNESIAKQINEAAIEDEVGEAPALLR